MSERVSTRSSTWRSRNVWSIALSASFADLGYQSVIGVFPLFVVVILHKPVWVFGLSSALSYGGGAFFAWLGGRLGNKVGHRRLAIIGNLMIPMLSFSALSTNIAVAIGLFAGGWWARNLRSPSRRVMLVDAVQDKDKIPAAFGFLHALDVGGGILAAVYVLVGFSMHISIAKLFIFTVIPLLVSSLFLIRTHSSIGYKRSSSQTELNKTQTIFKAPTKGLLVAATLYGFTYYSIGFPILSVAQKSHSLRFGIVAFLIFQATSSLVGLTLPRFVGASLIKKFKTLALFGYIGAGAGGVILAMAYFASLGVLAMIVGIGILGSSLGVVETLEPTLISMLKNSQTVGRGFGSLSAARSLGVFIANVVMGILYGLNPSLSYTYVAVVATIAGTILLKTVSEKAFSSSNLNKLI